MRHLKLRLHTIPYRLSHRARVMRLNGPARALQLSGLVLLLAGLVLPLTGCQSSSAQEAAPDLITPVDEQTNSYVVTRQDVYSLEVYDTEVTPELTELSFESSGTLDSFAISIGDTVSEGQVLATLSGSSDWLTSLQDQYEAMLDQHAEANHLTEIDIEIAELSGEDTSRAELEYKHTKELQALDEQNLLDQIEQARAGASDAEITAPCDGIVVSLASLYSGDAVAYHSPVIALATTDACYVSCDYIAQKYIDSSYRCYLMVDNTEYDLTYVPYDADTLSAALTAGTALSRFKVEGAGTDIIGAAATIYRVIDQAENVLAVPINSLYEDNDIYYVYVMDGDTRIQTEVTVGVTGAMYAEITDGLTEGVTVYVKE